MFVELDGQPVFADTGGCAFDPALPCLIFIHGAQHDHFVWRQQARWCADRGFAVLSIDLPGHGQSGGSPLPDIGTMADWLLALQEKVGAGGTAGTTLAGHSMGSLIALEAAARASGRIDRLVLLGTAVPMPVSPALLQAARDDEAKAMRMINQWSHSPRALIGGCGGHGLWLPAINLRIMERQRAGVLHTDLTACNAYTNGLPAAARLNCPVTLIAGSADRMTPLRSARKFAAALRAMPGIPDVALAELPAVGHALMAEAPMAICAHLMDKQNKAIQQ
jgi:pimeloyl-ACP methyl ester carboxylesterase